MTIEDAAELRLQQPHVVRLESRPAGVEGRGEVTIRDLLRNALRMRPDRIVIGEVRGAEALDLLTALNTGHDGALSTVHANSPADALEPAGDAGADGRGRAAARGDRRAGAARDRPRRPPRAPAPDGARVVTEIAEVVRAAGTTAVRTRRDRRRVSGAPAAAGAGRRRGRRAAGAGGAGGAAGQPGRGALAAAGAGAAAPGRAGGLRALDRRSAAGWRRSAPAPRSLAGWLLAGPALALPLSVAGPALAAWAISSRRRRYRAAVERSLPEVATAIADSLSAGRSLRASLPAAAASLDGPPAAELARLGAELDLGARDGRGGRGLAAADALGAGRRLRRGAAQPAARRRRPGRPAAPLRRRRRRARPGRRGRPLGHRPGPLHRPAGGGDAERRRPLRRADPARLPRQAARLAGRRRCCWRSPRPCSWPASSRSGASRGWSSERRRRCWRRSRSCSASPPRASCSPAGPGASCRRCPFGAARPLGRGRRCGSACRSGCAAPAWRRGCRSPAVLVAKLAGAALRRPRSRWPPPRRRRGGPALLVAIATAGGRLPRPRRAAGARGAAPPAAPASRPCPTPSTCSRSAPAPAAARRPASPQLARAGEGPLAEELRLTVAELSCGMPLGAALCGRCAPASPAASWRPWSPRSSARAASARRWPTSCAARPSALRRDSAAPSRSAPPAPRRRSSSSSPWSSSPRSC